ncbi:MAG: NADH-quinone oxidoreductase subunit L [Chloroflexi bacterium]|nr:NADH-quinone oxidoreductase subunit L [Chloroflexota bacterium]MQC28054.1 NADH-quinone oxidoreductase subunit L [Chloroflexota bacterium]
MILGREVPEAVVWAIYLAPVASFVAITALHRMPQFRAEWAGRITIAAVAIAWLASLWALDSAIELDGEALAFASHEWFTLFDLEVAIGVHIDGLSAIMLFVVSSVALLVQVYSVGYMQGDRGYARYFASMSLFTAAMLGLVLSSSLLQLFVHWELVGLSSYLLIGHWHHRPAAAAAAKKAFIVTRFGDFAFLLAVLLIWSKTGLFDIAEINELALSGAVGSAVLTGFTLGLFSGAVGKSAQFPLHIWLPDAMEGPTPVSALIHAATMVVAGVYLIARFFPSFEAAPAEVLDIVAYTGGFTALLAASMGLVQTDIKRVLAYSTISQIGYMVMALGLFGYVAAIFHLFTHAFFKALLFLGSGSVNHATHTFDMRRMGGLRQFMPITYWTFVIGSLSLAGVFPFAGFWSKDEILLDAWHEQKLLFVVGVLVAGMTALYMFRAIALTFWGDYKGGGEPEDDHGDAAEAHAEPHESPTSMTVPLLILAVPAVLFGLFGLGSGFTELLEGALPAELRHGKPDVEIGIVATSLVFALGGIGLGGAIYYGRRPAPELVQARLAPLHALAVAKYHLDFIAETVIVRWLLNGVIQRGAQFLETHVLDFAIDQFAGGVRRAGDGLRRVEAGYVQAYTSLFFIGLVIAVLAIAVVGADVLER